MIPPTALRVAAVVTAFDEEETVAETVTALRACEGLGDVVVVDDGSRDGTARRAREAGARVMRTPANLGKGPALDLATRRLADFDVYLLVDADVGETAREAGEILAPVLAGRLDLAVAILPHQQGGGLGLVKRLAAALIHAGTGFRGDAPLSGQRAVTRACLAACRPLARGFGLETAMTMDAIRLGFRVGEVPVSMSHRPTGRHVSGFLHRARQGVDVLMAALPRLAGVR